MKGKTKGYMRQQISDLCQIISLTIAVQKGWYKSKSVLERKFLILREATSVVGKENNIHKVKLEYIAALRLEIKPCK